MKSTSCPGIWKGPQRSLVADFTTAAPHSTDALCNNSLLQSYNDVHYTFIPLYITSFPARYKFNESKDFVLFLVHSPLL